MLKSALVAMTILGCNCEQNSCEYIRTADLQLESVADCQARIRGEIRKTNAEYPLIVAVCESRWQAPTDSTIIAGTETANPAQSQPVEPIAETTRLDRMHARYSAIMSSARNGASEFISVPASWLDRQIARVESINW
jgi:hypothetical protein